MIPSLSRDITMGAHAREDSGAGMVLSELRGNLQFTFG
jgi:hypothetical protein